MTEHGTHTTSKPVTPTPHVLGDTKWAVGGILVAVAGFVGVLATALLMSDPGTRTTTCGACAAFAALGVLTATIEWPRVEYR